MNMCPQLVLPTSVIRQRIWGVIDIGVKTASSGVTSCKWNLVGPNCGCFNCSCWGRFGVPFCDPVVAKSKIPKACVLLFCYLWRVSGAPLAGFLRPLGVFSRLWGALGVPWYALLDPLYPKGGPKYKQNLALPIGPIESARIC